MGEQWEEKKKERWNRYGVYYRVHAHRGPPLQAPGPVDATITVEKPVALLQRALDDSSASRPIAVLRSRNNQPR